MKKSISLIAGLLLFTLVASATDDGPRFEAFAGYTTLRTDLQSNTFAGERFNDNFFMHGGSAQLIYNFNKWFSGVADLGAVHKANISAFNVDGRTAFFLFGPRVSYKRSARWSPYFQVLFGAGERSATKSFNVVTGPDTPGLPVATPHDSLFPGPGVNISAEVKASQTDFAMTVGGGLDLKIAKRFALRPFAADYMLTTFPSIINSKGNTQHGLRLSAGVLFRFGGGQ